MADTDHTPPSFQSRGLKEQTALAQSILDVAKRNTYPLTAPEKQTLTQFITLALQKRPIPDALYKKMEFLIRQHEQNLIALTRKIR